MKIIEEYKLKTGDDIWRMITACIKKNQSFNSVTGIVYDAEVLENSICYIGGSGERGRIGETIDRADFVEAYDLVKNFSEINTNSIKHIIKSSLYRKRTPFIGLLYSVGIVIK